MPRCYANALLMVAVLNLGGCHKKPDPTLVYVSAESSGEIVAVDPDHGSLVARIAVGKRPRGLVVSPDGRLLYVALSGSPRGRPNVDESTLPPADRAADGIGVVDLAERKLLRTLPSGQDPESFDVSRDGKTLYVSNEEMAELSVLDLASGKITHKVPVGKEPEGVTLRPDGKVVYVTSEQDSIVTGIDTQSFAVVAKVATGRRPRAICFTKDGHTAFVSNELDSTLTAFDPHTPEMRPGSRRSAQGIAFSPRVTAEYDFWPALTAVVSYGEGFRSLARTANVATSEGISSAGPSINEGAPPFSKVRSYEAGLRACARARRSLQRHLVGVRNARRQ